MHFVVEFPFSGTIKYFLSCGESIEVLVKSVRELGKVRDREFEKKKDNKRKEKNIKKKTNQTTTTTTTTTETNLRYIAVLFLYFISWM